MEPWLRAYFGFMTMLIAVPTGVKIFSWLATLWGGSIRFTTSMMFALGFLALFTCGGISGVFLSNVPFDVQVHDTYFVVAHFHYVMFGGASMSILSALYYWFPKMSGRYLSESLGKVIFWLIFIGMNVTFMPMHWLGIAGMARRIYTYRPEFMGLNHLVSFGYLIMLARRGPAHRQHLLHADQEAPHRAPRCMGRQRHPADVRVDDDLAARAAQLRPTSAHCPGNGPLT
jgi:cytochrome c oxidase subunit 1